MLDKELQAAHKAAEVASVVQLSCLRGGKDVQIKGDRSPVTKVDRQCEERVREILLQGFPSDGFLGEETGEASSRSGRRWIVDPLDGTRPYIRGIPTFSVLIALEEDGVPVLGVMRLPGLGETYWAVKGGGAYLNGTAIRVSKVDDLAKAMGSALGFVEKADTAEGKKLLSFMRRLDYCYGFMDAYTYGSVACGRLDLSVNLLDKPWDCAAAACIVREAGGRFSDIRGEKTVHGGSSVLSNPLLHGRILEHFQVPR